jgi:hypothetical protein
MSGIMIDDDFDPVEEEETSSDSELKTVVKQGFKDLEVIVEKLGQLSQLMEPFGDSDTIDELIMLYSEIIPNILIGDYSEALEGLDKDDQAIARLALNRRRKDIISNLLEKYNN